MMTALLFSIVPSSSAFSANLSIQQLVTAERMKEIVFSKAITQRIVELCADFTADDEKLNAQRDAIMTVAKTMFSSGQEFMEAAGINEKARLGEDMRRFFLDRGVAWDSSAKEYCTLGDTLKAVQAPVSEYLLKRK